MPSLFSRNGTLILLSACLQLIPFPIAGPVAYWRSIFCWVCLVPLLVALLGKKSETAPTLRETVSLGYLCGFLWYLGNCYWIYPTMHIYGALPEIVSFGILILFSLYLGLYHALFAWLLGLVREKVSREAALLAAPFLWVATELARARITGFPWDLLGYAQVDNFALTRLAPWGGVMALSLVIATVNALFAAGLLLAPGRLRRVAFAGATLVACLLITLGIVWKPAALAAPQQAVLVQDNLKVGAEGDNHESRDQLLASLMSYSQHPSAGASSVAPAVILWPEAPADFFDGDAGFRAAAGTLAKTQHAPVIADSIRIAQGKTSEAPNRFYNSASFFAPDGSYAGHYDKMHLVPFGEYVPYKDLFFFAGHLLENAGTFTPGEEKVTFSTGGHRFGVFICYESIFGDEVREYAQEGADVLVNLSDDGWYGDSSAPWEHLNMVRMRAMENHRWVLRATNTGVTTVIDPNGVQGATLPRHERGALQAGFDFVSGTTFYTRNGDWVGWLCVFVSFGFLGFGMRGQETVH
ncbi:MAG: apolipoprotein N-acyltransferase [Micavibrio sp.]|nr:apolipoprotein N-acyltransferase [Micavibrio sp.]